WNHPAHARRDDLGDASPRGRGQSRGRPLGPLRRAHSCGSGGSCRGERKWRAELELADSRWVCPSVVCRHLRGSPNATGGGRPHPRERINMTRFERVERAIAAISRGEMVVMVDDEDRENEGDLVIAAEHCDAAAVNFMCKHGRGLICLSLTSERIEQLGL